MKKVFKAVAYCCGAVMGYAASMWDAGVCSGMMLVMVALAMGICICVCLHELAVIKEYERKEKEAVQHSAWKAEFFREVDKPI